MSDKLLEVLADNAKCVFISDLPIKAKAHLGKQFVARLVPTDYTLEEWNDAVSYIVKSQKKFSSVREAQDYLSGYLD